MDYTLPKNKLVWKKSKDFFEGERRNVTHLDNPHLYNLLSIYSQQIQFHSASNFCTLLIEIQLFMHFDLFKKASFIVNCGALGR